jgi:hypothetical protein
VAKGCESYANFRPLSVTLKTPARISTPGWPGGKPSAADATRPERAEPHPKRVLLFSPHPDDDVRMQIWGGHGCLSECVVVVGQWP